MIGCDIPSVKEKRVWWEDAGARDERRTDA